MVKRHEADHELKAEYGKRKSTIAFDVAEHAALLSGYIFAIKAMSDDVISEAPECKTQSYIFYLRTYSTTYNIFMTEIGAENENIIKLSFKIDLYLDADISNAYSEFIDAIYKKASPQHIASVFSSFEQRLNAPEIDCVALNRELAKLIDLFGPSDEIKSHYLKLIKLLGLIIPDVNRNSIYMTTGDDA